MEPKLYKEYVKDGTLRIEWRDFPYRGQESGNAAVAARAAEGRFWEYYDLLYENARYEPSVRADFQKGLNAGVNGTPTFFVNGKMLVGLQPIGVFENAIEPGGRPRVVEASFLTSFLGGLLSARSSTGTGAPSSPSQASS